MFSDFNPDADNIKKYPVLEGHLDREYGENLGSFGIIGEDTNPDGKKDPNIPSWMQDTEKVEKQATNIQSDNYIDNISSADLEKLKKIDLSSGTKMFQNKEYLKLFNVMRNDTNLDMKAHDVLFYLNEPAANWEEGFFDTQREPTRQEIDEVLVEVERQEPRKKRYNDVMNDLYCVYEAMSSTILTVVDQKKRDKLAKLIAQREILFKRESIYFTKLEKLKGYYFKKLDYDYYGMNRPQQLEKNFRSLFLKLKYQK